MEPRILNLKDQALLASLELSQGDLDKTFTAEELLVCAWEADKSSWGLRGFEQVHPDPEKMQKEVERRGNSLVRSGFFVRVSPLVFRLTPAGLSAASKLCPSNVVIREKADRRLEESIRPILEHPVFQSWLQDNNRPKHFREAGHFWGIAPGMPAKSVRERVERIENTLKAALELLNERNTDEIVANRGKILFDRNDISRCSEFNDTLKARFSRDLALLDPTFAQTTSSSS